MIIPHFTKYPLISKKKEDYILWSKVVNMKQNKEHLTSEGFSTILTYYASINRGASSKARGALAPRVLAPLGAKVTKYYTNIKAANKPNIELPKSLDPNWVSGFVAGDGGFSINIRIGRAEFRFHVARRSKEIDLLKLFIKFFNSGSVHLRSDLSAPRCDFIIQNFDDIINRVIQHFDKYPSPQGLTLGLRPRALNNAKQLDYDDFKQAALIVKSKKHLKSEDLDKIRKLKTKMNAGRPFTIKL